MQAIIAIIFLAVIDGCLVFIISSCIFFLIININAH